MTGDVYKDSGYRFPLTVEDGKPLCPLCGLPMIEVDPGHWKCPGAAEAEANLTEALKKRLGDASS